MNRKLEQLSALERANIFNSLFTRGKIKEVIRFICNCKSGGIILPGNIELKSGSYTCNTLHEKYSKAQDTNLKDIIEFLEYSEF